MHEKEPRPCLRRHNYEGETHYRKSISAVGQRFKANIWKIAYYVTHSHRACAFILESGLCWVIHEHIALNCSFLLWWAKTTTWCQKWDHTVSAFTQANSETRLVSCHHSTQRNTPRKQYARTCRAANSKHGLVSIWRTTSSQKIKEPLQALLFWSTKEQKRGRTSQLPSDLIRWRRNPAGVHMVAISWRTKKNSARIGRSLQSTWRPEVISDSHDTSFAPYDRNLAKPWIHSSKSAYSCNRMQIHKSWRAHQRCSDLRVEEPTCPVKATRTWLHLDFWQSDEHSREAKGNRQTTTILMPWNKWPPSMT